MTVSLPAIKNHLKLWRIVIYDFVFKDNYITLIFNLEHEGTS